MMPKPTKNPQNFPFWDVVAEADKLIGHGATIYMKFTCSNCGTRQTIDVPNTFFKAGTCEECRHETDCVKSGINYMVILGRPPMSENQRAAEIERNSSERDELLSKGTH